MPYRTFGFLVRSRPFQLVALGLILVLPAPAARWAAPLPAELADPKPAIEPDAGAEVLAAEATHDDSEVDGTTSRFYFRIKIFNDQGVTRLSKIELPYDDRTGYLSEIEARTIKADGTTVELSAKEIYDRVVVRSDRQRNKVKSFAPPALEPGVIIEYRYRSFREGHSGFFPLFFQGEFPVRSSTIRLRPLGLVPGLMMRSLFMNCPPQELKPEADGFYRFHMVNLPARRTEPFQPPALHLMASVLIYYSLDGDGAPEAFWAGVCRKLQQRANAKAKVTKAIARSAEEICAGETAPAGKLGKLHDFCRTKIVNRDRDGTGLTREQRRKLPVSHSADDTLKNKCGSSDDINCLFIALAKAAGFDARPAAGNDRTSFRYNPKLLAPFTFDKLLAAVKSGNGWSYYDPGATYLGAGMIPWRYGDTAIAIANEKGALIVEVASAPAAASHRHQTANLTLDEEGTLEGEVTLTYTGYFEAAEKGVLDATTPNATERHLKNMLEDNLKSLEISSVVIENANKALEPIKIRLHIKVPQFAERTGSRLFVQPSIFRRGAKPWFEAATRRSSIIFPHRYSELDEVSLTLPEGYEIEEGSAPLDLNMGVVGDYKVSLSWQKNRRILTYHREYRQDILGFTADKYPVVKQIFEIIQERDNHTLTFKRAEDPPAAKPGEDKS